MVSVFRHFRRQSLILHFLQFTQKYTFFMPLNTHISNLIHIKPKSISEKLSKFSKRRSVYLVFMKLMVRNILKNLKFV